MDEDAGVGEKRVNLAEAVERLRDQIVNVRGDRHISADDETLRRQLSRQRFQLVERAGSQSQLAAVPSQQTGGARADARTGAGDDDDFAGETIGH